MSTDPRFIAAHEPERTVRVGWAVLQQQRYSIRVPDPLLYTLQGGYLQDELSSAAACAQIDEVFA